MRCNSCEELMINNVRCHETGCPDAWQDERRDCKWCGSSFKPKWLSQYFCSHSCDGIFNDYECGCAECTEPPVFPYRG